VSLNQHDVADESRRQAQRALGDVLPDVTLPGYTASQAGQAGVPGFLALIVDTGPEAEPDYDDARYWARQVADSSQLAADPLSLDFKENGLWVTAHHLTERGTGDGGEGTHAITRGVDGQTVLPRYVWVTEVDLGGGKRHVFKSYPGQIFDNLYAYIVACLNDEGCPVGAWHRMIGPAVVEQVAPDECE